MLKKRDIITKFLDLTADSTFHLVDAVELKFDTFHPQGIVKLGEHFYISSVEVFEKPDQTVPGWTPGRGIGHLFKVNHAGKLVNDVQVTNAHIYHPGGIDFAEKYIWMPVAEYRPRSRSHIYRVDPDTMDIEPVFSVNDHISNIVYDRDDGNLYGMNWGSRLFYHWTRDGQELGTFRNPNHFVDLQDAKYIANHIILTSGHREYRFSPKTHEEKRGIGGLALFDLKQRTILQEIPIVLYRETTGRIMTYNAMDVNWENDRIRFYFAPDDNSTTICIYEV